MSGKRKNVSSDNTLSESDIKDIKKTTRRQPKRSKSKSNEVKNIESNIEGKLNKSSTPNTPVMSDVNKQNTGPPHSSQMVQDHSLFYPMNQQLQYVAPSQTMQQIQPQYCSTPNSFYQSTMQRMSPTSMAQKPPWVDDLFLKMENIDSRLNKLDNIESIVNNMNSKVIKVEYETQILSQRLGEVEHATQHFSDCFDDQRKKILELDTKIKEVNDKINSQSENVKRFNKQISEQKNEIDLTRKKVKDESVKMKEELMIDIQMKEMKNNLVFFYNIPEVEGEDCVNNLHIFFKENLNIVENERKINIKNASRIGKEGDRIRPLLVKFSNYFQKQEVRKSAVNLKDTNFGISEQLPVEILKRRKNLLPKLRALKENNIKAYFVRDKLFVAGKEYVGP